MNSSTLPIVHSTRSDMFQREATWRLGTDALEREGGEPAAAPWWAHLLRLYLRLIIPWAVRAIDRGGSARFPYGAIMELRLCFDPTRFDTVRHRCDVRIGDGRKARFYSTHFVSVMEFEDRAASYVALVRALVAKAAAANPDSRFRSGKRPLVYWAEHAFLLAMVALLVFVLALVGGIAITDLFLLKLGVTAAFIPVMIAYTRKNRPGSFDPRAIPAQVLPDS